MGFVAFFCDRFKTGIEKFDEYWEQYSKTDLPVGTKYVAIHYHSDYMYYLYIDDVVGPALAVPDPTDIEEQSQTNDVRFYVFENKLYVTDENNERGFVQLFNLMGQPVIEDNYFGRTSTIDLQLHSGYYVVKITTDSKTIVGKVYVK